MLRLPFARATLVVAMAATPTLAFAAPAAVATASSVPAPATMAIITQDQTWLRAAPRDSAQQQAVLSHGEVVEVRGERLDYVQVYDHKRERGGYGCDYGSHGKLLELEYGSQPRGGTGFHLSLGTN